MLKFGSKNDVTVVHRATIRLLDDTEIIHCDFQPQHKGKYILEYVCKQLNIIEPDYFGLRYVDQCKQRHWLDLAKTAIKQVKDVESILFSFRVKFYPPDPLRLNEEITRYQIYQQLKRDLLHGRLYCNPEEAALLAACILHNELGEYDPEIHIGSYISEHKFLLKQTETIEEKAMKLHQSQLKGFTAEQAEMHFLKLASQLDTYAVDPHPVKDHKGSQLYLGINHHGILTFHGFRQTNRFRWSEVQKINYEGKMFIVHLTINEDLRTKKKHTVGFKCPTGSYCRHVWRCAIEQMLFFTLPRASDAPVVSGGSIFSWGTKFKYTGRTEREVLEETAPVPTEPGEDSSSQHDDKTNDSIRHCQTTGLRRKASSVPATPSTPSQDLIEIRYSSLPRSCHSAGLDGAGIMDTGVTGGGSTLSSPYCPDNTLPLLETVSEDQEIYAKKNNAVDENDSHASATHITSITNRANQVKFRKITFDRPRMINSQRIIIGRKELLGQNIDKIVLQKINSLGKSPRVVKSTALIIKTSRIPIKPFHLRANNHIDASQVETFRSKIAVDTKPTRVIHDDGLVVVSHLPQVSSSTAMNKSLTAKIYGGFPTKHCDYGDDVPRMANGSIIIGRTMNRPIAFAMALAVAAAASTCGGNNCNGSSSIAGGNESTVGSGQMGDIDMNTYSFRDSFDYSVSESHMVVDGIDRLPSHVATSVSKMSTLRTTDTLYLEPVDEGRSIIGRSRALRSIRFMRLFVSAFVLTVTILFIIIVIVFETDSTVFDSIRKLPEMMAFKSQYYMPIREFLKTKLGLF